MPQIINTNVASLTAQRNLNSSQSSLATSLQRLSSGLRINSARDDAAGLAISQRMNAQVKSLNQAARNASDGISMIQTAEGGMSQIQDMLIRMKELATQGSNSTLADAERSFIADEMTQLRDEINNISTRTKFNGQQLLNGSFGKALDTTSTVQAGRNLATGTAAAVTKVDITGAQAGTTFTFSNAAGVLTLSDGTNSQAIDLTAVTVAAGGSFELNYNELGVKVLDEDGLLKLFDEHGVALAHEFAQRLCACGRVGKAADQRAAACLRNPCRRRAGSRGWLHRGSDRYGP